LERFLETSPQLKGHLKIGFLKGTQV